MSCTADSASSLNSCRDGAKAIQELVEHNIRVSKKYDDDVKEYNAQLTKWTREKNIEDGKLEDGFKVSKPYVISKSGKRYNCNNIDKAMEGCCLHKNTQECHQLNNDNNQVEARCAACGYNKCNCESGECKKSCSKWQRRDESTYQTTYDRWVRNNPRPIAPVRPVLGSPNINIVCQDCRNCIDMNNITGSNVSDIQQINQCISQIEQNIAEKEREERLAQEKIKADREAQEARTEAERIAAEQRARELALALKNTKTTKTTQIPARVETSSVAGNNTMLFVGIGAVVLLIVIGIFVALLMGGDDE